MSKEFPHTEACQQLNVAVVPGHSCALDRNNVVPFGHCLSRARRRHLQTSDQIVVTADLLVVGLAAYQRVASDVRVVHELLLDVRLECRDAARVIDALLASLELAAYDDDISCVMISVGGSVSLPPFAKRGYIALVVDPDGAWLEKRIDRRCWVSAGPQAVN